EPAALHRAIEGGVGGSKRGGAGRVEVAEIEEPLREAVAVGREAAAVHDGRAAAHEDGRCCSRARRARQTGVSDPGYNRGFERIGVGTGGNGREVIEEFAPRGAVGGVEVENFGGANRGGEEAAHG